MHGQVVFWVLSAVASCLCLFCSTSLGTDLDDLVSMQERTFEWLPGYDQVLDLRGLIRLLCNFVLEAYARVVKY